jgi:hypothetical protein
LFRGAYPTTQNLYREIQLKKITPPDYIPHFDFIVESVFCKGNDVLRLTQSETALLKDYLRTGKICNFDFRPDFKMLGYFDLYSTCDIETDGRFYRFVTNGKRITIDIGFNFYQVNKKIWERRDSTNNGWLIKYLAEHKIDDVKRRSTASKR